VSEQGDKERLVVVLDAASDHRAALNAAARLAARWGAPLHGLFVKDDELIRLSHLPFARQVTLGKGAEPLTPPQAERQMRVFAERARQELAAVARRHGVDWSFEIVPDAPEGDVIVVTTGDFMVAGIASRPIGRHFRVEGRWWSARPASASLLYAHHDRPERGTVVAVLRNREPAAERLLEFAARFAAADDETLTVICPPELAETPDFTAWLHRSLAEHVVETELDVAPADAAAVIRRIASLDCRLVAVENGAALAQPKRLRELVAKTACDVLVVR
jgi:hypothetical protein